MIDHVRTVLYQSDGPYWLQTLAAALLPTHGALDQVMRLIHSTELARYVYEKDDRVTYLPFDEVVEDCPNIVDIKLTMIRLVTPEVEEKLFLEKAPYNLFKQLWQTSDNIAYQLGALALAIAYRLEEE